MQHLGTVGRHRHRADADVPAVLPAAGDDEVPRWGLERDVDLEPLGDGRRDVDVEALELPIVADRGLRRVTGVRRDAQHPALLHQREQIPVPATGVGARIGGSHRRLAVSSPGTTAARSDQGQERKKEHEPTLHAMAFPGARHPLSDCR